MSRRSIGVWIIAVGLAMPAAVAIALEPENSSLPETPHAAPAVRGEGNAETESETKVATKNSQPPDPAAIDAWIAGLNSDSYVARERAMIRLEQAGAAALEPLAKAADGNNLEVASRAVRVLQQFGESDDDELALAALERIADLQKRPAESSNARAVLREMRARRAIEIVRKLGAEEKTVYEVNGQRVIAHLVVGKKWKGGEEGLKHVAALEGVQRVSIYNLPITDKGILPLKELEGLGRLELYGTAVTDDGVAELKKLIPNTEIDVRGGAMFGVGGTPHPQGAQVSIVQPESAAQKAGIQLQDVITKFNGQPIKDFETLTAFIAKSKPGETAKVEILRGEETMTKEITFGLWE